MSPRVSLLALFACVGVTVLLFSLARLDLSRVPTGSSQLELRHSYSDSSSTKHSSGPELLAFIGVQVKHKAVPLSWKGYFSIMLVFSACWLNIHSVALQTGFTTSTEAKYNYKARREALRHTWFPDSQEGLDRSSLRHLYTCFTTPAKSCLTCLSHKLQRFILKSDSRLTTDTNMVMRFVIGQTSDPAQEAELVAESSQYGGFMRLHLQVHLSAYVFFCSGFNMSMHVLLP